MADSAIFPDDFAAPCRTGGGRAGDPGGEDLIEYLAQLGENFSYVRATVDGKTWWGFVYTWTMGHG